MTWTYVTGMKANRAYSSTKYPTTKCGLFFLPFNEYIWNYTDVQGTQNNWEIHVEEHENKIQTAQLKNIMIMTRSRPATDHALQQDIVPRPHWQSAADLSGSRAKLVPICFLSKMLGWCTNKRQTQPMIHSRKLHSSRNEERQQSQLVGQG